MSADEYKQFLLNNPEEAKKLDEPGVAPTITPTGFWRNGAWVKAETQTTVNGVAR